MCLVFCFAASPVHAEEKKVVRVAFPNQQGFSNTDEKGNHTGYSYEFLQEIAKYTGWEYEFITGDDSNESLLQMMEDLKNGEVDIMGGMLYSDELAQDYDFPEYNCGYSYSTLAVLKDNNNINATNYSTFENMKVGVLATAKRRIQALEDFCKANGITVQIVSFENDEERQKALNEGEIDAVLGSDVTPSDNQRFIARFDGRPYYFAVTKGNSEIVSGINTATSTINEKDPNYATDLYMKYFNPADSQRVTLERFIKANPIESIIAALLIGLVLAVVVGLTMYIRIQRNRQLLLDYERYRVLSEMSSELIFEYDYSDDSIMVSEPYAPYFGGKARNEHFAVESLKTSMGTSEAVDCFAKLIGRRPPEQARYETEFQARMISGNIEWVRGTSVIIYNKHNQPLRAVGKIININQEKCEREALINQARHDALTGLYNRTTFEHLVNQYLEQRGEQEGAIMVVDLDHFKTVNDTLGHQGGDEVLEDLAREMSGIFGEDAILGRLGGDEFLVFVRDIKERLEEPVEKARALCQIMYRCYKRGNVHTEVSISVGLAYSGEESGFEKLYGMADTALYYMKAHGKNNVTVYDASLEDALGNNGNTKRKGAF
nr:GGDEF domain-containing protein [Eubacterium sp. 1001713B170207_170306_E7]